MSIEFTVLESANLQAFYETLLRFWNRNWDAKFQREFLEWRYERRIEGETLVAMSGAHCIGLIDTFIRPYLVKGRRMMLREPCDWYCEPGNRGVGMRLMERLYALPEPLISVGMSTRAVAMLIPTKSPRHSDMIAPRIST